MLWPYCVEKKQQKKNTSKGLQFQIGFFSGKIEYICYSRISRFGQLRISIIFCYMNAKI